MRWFAGALMMMTVGLIQAGEPAPRGVAVVELFTSQGCSSCPPADKVLEGLAESAQPGVYPLSFHVTYWDYLGWRDPFGDVIHDDRQRTYARVLSEKVYTPQMIVNGQTVFVGSYKRKANAAIDKALAQPVDTTVTLTPGASANGEIAIVWSVSEMEPGQNLNVALVAINARSEVTRGENRGRSLHHANVVRAFTTTPVKTKSGQVVLHIPAGLDLGEATVVAYLQDRKTMHITAAASVPLSPPEG